MSVRPFETHLYIISLIVGVIVCTAEDDVPLYAGSSFTYSWIETEAESMQQLPCPEVCKDLALYPTEAVVKRKCVAVEDGAKWDTVDFSGCQLTVAAFRLCEANQVSHHPVCYAVHDICIIYIGRKVTDHCYLSACYCFLQLESDVVVAATVASITANRTQVEASEFRVASNIIERLTGSAIEDSQVWSFLSNNAALFCVKI